MGLGAEFLRGSHGEWGSVVAMAVVWAGAAVTAAGATKSEFCGLEVPRGSLLCLQAKARPWG